LQLSCRRFAFNDLFLNCSLSTGFRFRRVHVFLPIRNSRIPTTYRVTLLKPIDLRLQAEHLCSR
jgi:hypothetical protein